VPTVPKTPNAAQSARIICAEPEWMTDNPDIIPVNGDQILAHTETFIRRFCVFSSEDELVAVTLWAAHAHMAEHFHTTPRLALLSPEVGSGKTRVLEVLDLLVPYPMFCLSASLAAIFRTLAETQITLLVDEVDTIFHRKGKDDGNEDLRALLNAGYKRGATIPRCVGPKHDVQHFAVFAATALAGLGDLPDTVMSRSIIVRMRRRAPDEHVEPFRIREHEARGHLIRDHLAAWGQEVGGTVGAAWPPMPEGVVDRPAEVWEPLIAVADAAGGGWPARARAACLALVKVAAERRASLGIRLLADLRTIFGEADALYTQTVLERLHKGEDYGLEPDAPWPELHGKPLGERGLASMLKKYGISPVKVREAGGIARQGYRRTDLWDAWHRYLPLSHGEPEQAEQAEQAQQTGANIPDVPGVPDVTGRVSVRCRDCAGFDLDGQAGCGALYCLKFNRRTDPDSLRDCPAFQVPV
jgi:Protein of unknown function (DUF3631)